jgi:hypothetical protein
VISLVSAAPVWAQENPGEQPARRDGQRQAAQRIVKVFPLQHTEATEIANVVGRTVNGQLSVDPRTNSLIVSADENSLQQVEALLKQLDRPATDTAERMTTQYIPLGFHAHPDLLNAARAAASERMRLSAIGNLLQVVGTDRDITSVRELVEHVTRSNQARTTGGVQLTFYFLQTSMGAGDSKGGEDLPPALSSVVKALGENGFQNARMLAPLIVHANTMGEPFQIRGACAPDREVSVNGRIQPSSSAGGGIMLQVSAVIEDRKLGVNPGGPMGERITKPFTLETSIATRIGDYVVLAASPDRSAGGSSAIVLVVHATAAAQ